MCSSYIGNHMIVFDVKVVFLPDLATLFCSCKTFYLIWQINGWLLLLLLLLKHQNECLSLTIGMVISISNLLTNLVYEQAST